MLPRRAPLVAMLVLVVGLPMVANPAPVTAADAPVYHLPASSGTELIVSRGNGDAPGRDGAQRFAFHFVAADEPERFEVAAARGGTVLGTRTGVPGGRCAKPLDGPRPACWRDVNYVLIDHGDGTSALYSHLKRGEPLVRRGEVVSVGQPIGTAGSSGWTDRPGLGFQVQETPSWNAVGSGGWFLSQSLPVAFVEADGEPLAGDSLVSANPGARFEPFRLHRRPTGLPANVPFEPGIGSDVVAAYEADSPHGYGLRLAIPDGVAEPGDSLTDLGGGIRPLFGGSLAFAGCAAGAAASLGRTVAVELEVEGVSYLAVHGGLPSITPALLESDAARPLVVGPEDVIGRFGEGAASAGMEALDCPGSDPAAPGLFVTILRDAAITPEGQIMGGTPVSPEPLVGERGYEGFAWWYGPVVAQRSAEEPGQPRARWNDRTPASGSHIPNGEAITLKARVRDVSDIDHVRFRAWYPRWPQGHESAGLISFDPATSWRQLAVCVPPGEKQRGFNSHCTWDGTSRDGKVTYLWRPETTGPQPSAPWLPRARQATSTSERSCVPVSLAVEVIDKAGHVHSEIGRLPLPTACDDAIAGSVAGARIVYLDPLVPPAEPTSRGKVRDRGWPAVYEEDPLDGAIVWRDRSDNEDGFRIYARRHWFEADCSVTQSPWRLVATVAPNRERYRPNHQKVQRSLPVPDEIQDVPGWMAYWEYAVSAYNEAGETPRVRVGGFVGGSEAFCDPGLVPPPELEP